MKYRLAHAHKGFTLIELLVVISIIGLLSTIVLAAVQQSRLKALNVAKNALVREYVNASELFYDAHQEYPNVGSGCLGINNPDNSCRGEAQNDTLNLAFAAYIAGPPGDSHIILDENNQNLGGIYYDCITVDNDGKCTSTWFEWTLDVPYAENASCGIGKRCGDVGSQFTECRYSNNDTNYSGCTNP
jgi:prepilin-type N-terminal cleavage/methylation domain-containing protein